MGDDAQGTPQARTVELRVKLRYENLDVMVERFAVNVGTVGVFLPTKTVYPVGTQVRFELRLADETPALVGVGTVKAERQADPNNRSAAFGMSLELRRVSPDSRALLIKLMEARRTAGLPDVLIPSPEDVERGRELMPGGAAREVTPKPVSAAPADPRRRSSPMRVPQVVRIPDLPSKKDEGKAKRESTPAINVNVVKSARMPTPLPIATPAESKPATPVEPATPEPAPLITEPAPTAPATRADGAEQAPVEAPPQAVSAAMHVEPSVVVDEARVEAPPQAGSAPMHVEPSVEDIQPQRDSSQPRVAGTQRGSSQPRRSRRALAIASFAVVVLGGVLVYRWVRTPDRATETSKSPKPAAAPVAISIPDAAVVVDQSVQVAERAERAISERRIASPPGDNALELITKLEREHPGDQRAQALRRRAVDQLLASAQALWDHDKRDSARQLYAEVLQLEPENEIAKPRGATASKRFAGNEGAQWLATQTDLAIVEHRLTEALPFVAELRKISPGPDTERIGHELAHALALEAKQHPDQATTLLAAEKEARGDDGSGAPRATAPRDVQTNDLEPAKRWIAKGNASLAAKRFADAATSFQNALATDASAPAALAGLAEASYNQGDFQRAVDNAKRAVAQMPRNVAYRMTLAKSYYKLSRYADAISHWEKVLEIDPANQLAKKNIAMSQSKM